MSKDVEYGFVIGDQCGVILEKSKSDEKITFVLDLRGKKTVLCHIDGNVLKGSVSKSVFEISINEDGTGKGIDQNGQPVFLIRGKKTSDGEATNYAISQGMRMSNLAAYARRNKFPPHDAIGYYSYREEDYMFNTYIFKTGFRHYSYGPQPKIRTFIAKKEDGQWQFSEDNSRFE